MAINRVIIAGNLTRDPEMRVSASGTSIARFGLAVNDRVKNQQTGEWEDYPNFIDCVAFNGLADTIGKYLQKGAKISLEGRLHYSSWQAQDGTNRSKIEVVANQIEFMSRREGNGGANAANYASATQAPAQAPIQAQAPYQAQQAMPVVNASVYDDDIPF